MDAHTLYDEKLRLLKAVSELDAVIKASEPALVVSYKEIKAGKLARIAEIDETIGAVSGNPYSCDVCKTTWAVSLEDCPVCVPQGLVGSVEEEEDVVPDDQNTNSNGDVTPDDQLDFNFDPIQLGRKKKGELQAIALHLGAGKEVVEGAKNKGALVEMIVDLKPVSKADDEDESGLPDGDPEGEGQVV